MNGDVRSCDGEISMNYMCSNGVCSYALATTGTNQMTCGQYADAWAGFNFLLYAGGCALILGILIAVGYSLQDWLKAASERRAEFVKSLLPEASAKTKR